MRFNFSAFPGSSPLAHSMPEVLRQRGAILADIARKTTLKVCPVIGLLAPQLQSGN